MTPGTAYVHFIFPDRVPPEDALASITAEEKSRAGRFRFLTDASRWIACRAGLRKILGEIIGLSPLEVPLVFEEFGKPGLAPPYQQLQFNLSHCTGMALVAVCRDGPVGIDLEPKDRARSLFECETSFCHPQEIRDLPEAEQERAARLLKIWTAKEAVLKALGTGLSHPPEKVRMLFETSPALAISDGPLADLAEQRLHVLDDSRLSLYQAAISVPQTVREIHFICTGGGSTNG